MDLAHPPTVAPPPPPLGAPGPVTERERIYVLDVLRGFALLGILFVNIQVFGEPLGKMFDPAPPKGLGVADTAAHYFVAIFCEGKFYLLFSLLFGMGLVVQMNRAAAAGRRFGGMYARRLVALMAIGLTHGLLLWYGDILLLYGVMGLALLLMSRARPKTMVIVAASILTFTTLLAVAGGGLAMVFADKVEAEKAQQAEKAAGASGAQATGAGTGIAQAVPPGETPNPQSPAHEASPGAPADGPGSPDAPAPVEGAPTPDAPPAPPPPPEKQPATPSTGPPAGAPASDGAQRGPLMRLFKAYGDGKDKDLIEQNMQSKTWMALETEAFRDGPYLDALGFRVMLMIGFFFFSMMGFGWSIVAMFLLGAALMKWEIFRTDGPGGERRKAWYRRFVLIGLLIGVPGCVLMATAPVFLDLTGAVLVITPVCYFAPLALMLGYFGGVCLLVGSGRLRRITDTIARAGRMPLSNYLLQTVLATALFYHWGLGLFGQTTWAERMGIVLAIYAVNLAFSALWLKYFRMGPMEWVWRSVTYWKPQRLAR